MEPTYFIENRYSFIVDALPEIENVAYEVDTPETSFERSIQRQLAIANRLLMGGQYSTALAKYRGLRGTISAVIHPDISVANGSLIDWGAVEHAAIIETVLAKTAEMLVNTPVVETWIPDEFRGTEVSLPDPVAEVFGVYAQVGVHDGEGRASVLVQEAATLVEAGAYDKALASYNVALRATEDRALSTAIMHDMAIMQERTGQRDEAIEMMKGVAERFGQLRKPEEQVAALTALAGIQARGGETDEANATLKEAETLRKRHNLFPILSARPPQPSRTLVAGREAAVAVDTPLLAQPVHVSPVLAPQPTVVTIATEVTKEFEAMPAKLIAAKAFAARKTEKQFTILDSKNQALTISLDGNAAGNLANLYQQLSTTNDLGLLMGFLSGYTVTVAYLTHVYFWVIPMAMGDCYAALGSHAQAESEYLSTLNYQYLNQVVESVNLWLRLAELYLDWGDRLYRLARNDVSEFGKAKAKYELVMRLNNTIDSNSPLYKSSKFAGMRNRATAAIQALFVNNTSINENPRLIIALLRARIQLTKIANNLNFIGLGVHIPPFSFEYLQILARYFAQHASQVEQMYIQFQSTGENEELREEQMAQQADIAAASVELEERGLDEAREGVDVAQTNLNYTDVQHQNAVQAANDFAGARWELLELDTLQAWASASSVDRDDQVKLTLSGYSYYSADSKRRNVVLKELANQRTRISHGLEANRLQREINSAAAYRGVAQQQVQQAQARVAIAEQRVAIAKMQEQHARENLEFLEGREFSSAMWYNLAREARRLAQRYLDMAIEIATMMEKAYEAETGRDLRKIKFEYGLNHLNGLLGAEALLLDIDFFSLDYVRTKSKRAQMKQSISLADLLPLAFERLLATGQTYFETTLEHFDRRYPGFYLQKVKQAEVVFVGLTGSEGVHGTLRNIGVSKFRAKDGTIVDQVYPADVMPLSEYNVRQDAIVFQLENKELRLFENNGVATMWQLDLPRGTNTFDLRQILDVQLVLYYDGYFDATLEEQVIAALPTSGSASRGLSLQLYAPDELFFLRSQGTAELEIEAALFPANHTNQVLTSYHIQARGDNVAGLQVRVDLQGLGAGHLFQLDGDGLADGAVFAGPVGRTLFDTWTLTISQGDNPGFDLTGLDDLSLFVEYDFDFRS
jgi:tetratricopeptide (TPR) repeat protein